MVIARHRHDTDLFKVLENLVSQFLEMKMLFLVFFFRMLLMALFMKLVLGEYLHYKNTGKTMSRTML